MSLINNSKISENLMSLYGSFKNLDSVSGKRADLSEDIEYLAAALFGAIYNTNFINLNEQKENYPYIDLIDSSGIGIQVTKEAPSSKKIKQSEKALGKDGCKTVIVFFFVLTNCKIKCKKSVYAYTIPSITFKAKNNLDVCERLLKITNQWCETDLHPSRLFSLMNDSIVRQVASGKVDNSPYQPETYYSSFYEEEKIDSFLCAKTAKSFQRFYSTLLLKSPAFHNMVSIDSTGLLKEMKDNFEEKVLTYGEKVTNLINVVKETISRKESSMPKWSEDHEKSNNSLIEGVMRLSQAVLLVNSNFLLILKDAGQGKSSLMYHLMDSFLAANRLPAIAIIKKNGTDSIRNDFNSKIESFFGSSNTAQDLQLLGRMLNTTGDTLSIIIDGLNEYDNPSGVIGDLSYLFDDLITNNVPFKVIMFSRPTVANKYLSKIKRIPGIKLFEMDDSPFFSICEKEEDLSLSCYKLGKIKNKKFHDIITSRRLLFRIFCESEKGQSSPSTKNSLTTLDIYEKYFSKIGIVNVADNLFHDETAFNAACQLVARKMIANKSRDSICASLLSEEERRKMSCLVDGNILVLKDGPKSYYSYTFDEFRDYFLSEVALDENDDSYLSLIREKWLDDLDGFQRIIFLMCRERKKPSKEALLHKVSWFLSVYCRSLKFLPYELLREDDTDQITDILLENTLSFSSETLYDFLEALQLFITPLAFGYDDPFFSIDDLLCKISDRNKKTFCDLIGTASSDGPSYIEKSVLMMVKEHNQKSLDTLIRLFSLCGYKWNLRIQSSTILNEFGINTIGQLDSSSFSEESKQYLTRLVKGFQI